MDDRGGEDKGRGGFRRRKSNPLQEAKVEHVTYRDVNLLKYFVSERGRIIPRRMTGVSAKQQREIARAVKQARGLGLLPYIRYEG